MDPCAVLEVWRSIRGDSIRDAIVEVQGTEDVFDLSLVIADVVLRVLLHFDELIDPFSIGGFFQNTKSGHPLFND